ncbi:DUF1995-containing protein [Fragilaria crotonensis]|nr:DUF1995-containing protein [Fragilaria crotonensis]
MVRIASSSYSAVALITFLLPTCYSFILSPVRTSQRNVCLYQDLDDLRNMLESSWNVESMGQVPNTPQSAAEEAASAIIGARNDGLGNICFVDLLLPQYDIQQGPNLYDEVEAVDFCRLLANCLRTRSVIYVKDEKSLKTVSKVLDARERERGEKMTQQDQYEYVEVDVEIDEDDEDRDNDDGEDDDDKAEGDMMMATQSEVVIYDDFSDFASADTDAFFSLNSTSGQQFASKLGDVASTNEPAEGKEKRTKIIKKLMKRKVEQPEATTTLPPSLYRLASLFGDKMISSGAGMSDSVVQAVKAHGLPKAEEETMILLSANSDEEMLAIRALVSKYADKKKIVLVNCKLDPLPRELEDCHTVYHLTPLIATTTIDPRNLFSKPSKDGEQRPPIKVVSIRRYPGEWEVYVDVDGSGFILAERASANKFTKQGPSFDWIGGAVKSFLS